MAADDPQAAATRAKMTAKIPGPPLCQRYGGVMPSSRLESELGTEKSGRRQACHGGEVIKVAGQPLPHRGLRFGGEGSVSIALGGGDQAPGPQRDALGKFVRHSVRHANIADRQALGGGHPFGDHPQH